MNKPLARHCGFTLIEVLVALAVVVVAFLAMYGSAQQVVRATSLQQEKTFASWVAFDQLTELRLADQLPQGERLTGETEMAGSEWRYVVEINDVESEYYRQAVVTVSPAEEPGRILAKSLAVVPVRSVEAIPPGTSGNALYSSDGTVAGVLPDPQADLSGGINDDAPDDDEPVR